MPKKKSAKPVRPGKKTLAGGKRFRVILIDRGPNVAQVRDIESGAGGRPSEPTPYEVTSFKTRPPAEKLVRLFEAAGASAEVR